MAQDRRTTQAGGEQTPDPAPARRRPKKRRQSHTKHITIPFLAPGLALAAIIFCAMTWFYFHNKRSSLAELEQQIDHLLIAIDQDQRAIRKLHSDRRYAEIKWKEQTGWHKRRYHTKHDYRDMQAVKEPFTEQLSDLSLELRLKYERLRRLKEGRHILYSQLY